MALEESFVSRGDDHGVMEERRLMYVGMTRAKRELQISYARTSSWGNVGRRSRFIGEIDDGLLEEVNERDSAYGFDYGFGAPVYRRVAAPSGDVSNGVGRPGIERSRPTARAREDGIGSAGATSSIPSEWEFKAGEKVTHASFGRGVVVNARRSGGDVVLNVAFVEAGLKQLLASMAKLARV